MISKNRNSYIALTLTLAIAIFYWVSGSRLEKAPVRFNGQRALEDVHFQVELGPRIPGRPAHERAVDWIVAQLQAAGWKAEVQETNIMGHTVRNVVGRWGEGYPWVILGAHYDSRLQANQDSDPQKQTEPVPGANDGASGVAVLLELARSLPLQMQQLPSSQPAWVKQVWLVFFDAEDNGNIPGWDWILGSRAFVSGLEGRPSAAVIVDMIGDADLNIYQEKNSDPTLTADIWTQAADLGYSTQFIAKPKFQILDDHIPFKQAGIPAVDLIDFTYPYWHTSQDTPDKVSAQSLQTVGETLLAWLTKNQDPRSSQDN